MSIKQAAKEERKKFSEIQGFSKKAGYIWDYYRYWILGTIAVVAFCISIGNSVYHNIKYTQIFYCAIFNNPLPEEYLDSLNTEFSAYYGLDPESETIYFDCSYILDDNGDPQTNIATIQKAGAMIAAKSIDFMIGDAYTLEQYASDGYFYNLEELLPADTYAALSDYIISYTNIDDGTVVPCALDLSQSEPAKRGELYVKEPIGGIVINSENPLVAVEFVKYLFGL